MTNKVIIGIDPGQTGGVAIIYGAEIKLHVMPDILAFAKILEDEWIWGTPIIYIEKAQSFPKGGVAGMFNYGRHFGELLGVIAALKIPHVLVPPAVWPRVVCAGCKGGNPKARNVEAARRLFPTVNLLATARSKVPHLGLTDALLICHYGVLKERGIDKPSKAG
jgi:crossover junction endodeoxyribonuclease RuvC